MRKNNTQKGYTLVEMLVAVTIFILIFVGIISIFLAIHKAQLRAEAVRLMQENIRYATEIITSEFRNSGVDDTHYTGGVTNPELELVLNSGVTFDRTGDRITMIKDLDSYSLTDERIEVTVLNFYILPSDFSDGEQEKVIIFISAKDKKIDEVNMNLQTTISSRVYY